MTSRAARLPSPRGRWSSSASEGTSRRLLQVVREGDVMISVFPPRVLKKVGYIFGVDCRQIMTLDWQSVSGRFTIMFERDEWNHQFGAGKCNKQCIHIYME